MSEPGRFERFWNEPDLFDGGTGESFHDVKRRALACLNDVVDTSQGKMILVATHSATLKLLMAHFEGRPLRDIWNPPFLRPPAYAKSCFETDGPTLFCMGIFVIMGDSTVNRFMRVEMTKTRPIV
ncbi:histidine phosphatase family protein [Paenibacillus allorhizosphaerae]|uniref:Histidine phosphatase family protein n=1 Tax=Paenibacillus allorhizosphaerae TaxID=2849866 RepID=A0ABM8VF49_9BACL|nr:histidine phosphatase family protein [Paenibacillus allorhizosphaerae]CAG7633519.1 hypothetical protein PAECIP111802_01956 [Paenibacillus allorhizosphaerae]